MAIVNQLASHTYELAQPAPQTPRFVTSGGDQAGSVAKAQEVHDAFSAFIGETFYGQMIKSMRSTVGQPAYFHGGHAEEMFQSQLDQQLAQEWAEQSGDRFAEPMFAQQFPQHAELLRQAQATASPLDALNHLRRY